MAPRRTSKQRTNAAIKVLQPFGFHKKTILKTINMLLKAYGGEGGWAFIEEESYKLVIERILEDQEEGETAEKKEGNAEVETGGPSVCGQNPNDVNDDDVNGDTKSAEWSINWRDIPLARRRASEPRIPMVTSRDPCYGWISESEDESDDPTSNDGKK